MSQDPSEDMSLDQSEDMSQDPSEDMSWDPSEDLSSVGSEEMSSDPTEAKYIRIDINTFWIFLHSNSVDFNIWSCSYKVQ